MIGKRLKEVRTHFKMKQYEFAQSIDVKASAISQMEADKINPSIETMQQIYKAYKVNLHWLITGKGDMLMDKDAKAMKFEKLQSLLDNQINDILNAKNNLHDNDTVEFRVSGEIAAGEPVTSINTILEVVSVHKSQLKADVKEYLTLRVNGRSMEPEVKHNDVILIRKDNDWQKLAGRICAVRIDGEVTLKKLVLDADKKMIVLVSINESYKPILVYPADHSDVHLIGHLCSLVRRMNA
jgi:SOS-response transcriptional repressor LexA